MKLLISALLFCGLVAHGLASDSLPEARNERVDFFRDEIFYRFGRLQSFYDNVNAEMRRMRLDHVALISETYNRMMQVFGEELDFVRRATVEIEEVIDMMTGELGANNACLQGVIADHRMEMERVNRDVQACAVRANTTMQTQLRDVFYPEFHRAQQTASMVPIMVMDALARGNVMGDEQEIIDYLASQYDFVTNQWPVGIRQVLLWEVSRFRVETDFYIDEVMECLTFPVYLYIRDSARLIYEAEMCH